MKIGIIGYGKMGQLIENAASAKGHTCISIDPINPNAAYQELSNSLLDQLDVCIEFSHPDCVLENISKIVASRTNLVVGTTGWYSSIDTVRLAVQEAQIGFIYASNFSVGVHIFSEIVRNAAKIINKFEEYDIAGVETHHNQKADSPSGTARTLAEILVENLDRKEKLVFETLDRKIDPKELHFTSVRCGHVPGIHEINMDSEVDTITLKHSARNRGGFAKGAVFAAEWLANKKGFFSIQDLVKETITNATS